MAAPNQRKKWAQARSGSALLHRGRAASEVLGDLNLFPTPATRISLDRKTPVVYSPETQIRTMAEGGEENTDKGQRGSKV